VFSQRDSASRNQRSATVSGFQSLPVPHSPKPFGIGTMVPGEDFLNNGLAVDGGYDQQVNEVSNSKNLFETTP